MPQDKYPFNRPIIILAAPRSGSTLLFEVLSQARGLWTIGDESHGIFESIAKFNPMSGLCSSNRLLAEDANDDDIALLRQRFYNNLQDRDGNQYNNASERPRFLEKTPKNALRIPLLNKIFPDALYILLYRNPRDNISSIMDAWRSQRYVTYPKLKGRTGNWSLLLPPGWATMNNKPLEDIACFQWEATNATLLDDLQALIPKERWRAVSYTHVVKNTEQTLKELCAFCGLEFDDVLQQTCRTELKMSRYTLSAPSPTKWHKHAHELNHVIASVKPTLNRLRQATLSPLDIDFDIHISENLLKQKKTILNKTSNNQTITQKPSRNAPCPCGSGLKYKRCHGKM